MKCNSNYTKDFSNIHYLSENDGLFLDYDEIHAGILRGEEDIKCGRYYDLKTGMNKLKRLLANE